MANGVNASGSITKTKRAMNSPCEGASLNPTQLAIPGWPRPHRSSRAARMLPGICKTCVEIVTENAMKAPARSSGHLSQLLLA